MAKEQFAAYDMNSVLTSYFEDWFEKKPVNQSYKIHPLLDFFMSNKIVSSGGAYHKCAILDNVSPVGGFYRGDDTINFTGVDPITHAYYRWVRIQEPVVLTRANEEEAEGAGAILQYAEEQVDAAVYRILDKLATALVASTYTDGLDMIPVMSLVDSTGTIGGINQSNQSWWASYESNSALTFTATGPSDFETGWLSASKWKGIGEPDKVFVGDAVWNAIRATGFGSMTYFQNANGAAPAYNVGHGRLMYNDAEIVRDPYLNTNTALMLNSKTLGLCVKQGSDLKVEPWFDLRPGYKMGRATNVTMTCQTYIKSRAANAKWTNIS